MSRAGREVSAAETLVVTVTGPADQLSAFAAWCLTVEKLCGDGASRTVTTPVDGDGSGALRFDFGDTDVSQLTAVDATGADEVRTPGIGE